VGGGEPRPRRGGEKKNCSREGEKGKLGITGFGMDQEMFEGEEVRGRLQYKGKVGLVAGKEHGS